MIEPLATPTDPEEEKSFEPILTQEALAATDVRIRSDVADESRDEEDTLPVCLQVKSVTRRAIRRVWLLLIALGLVSVMQWGIFLKLRHRDPIRIYEEAPSDFLVQP